MHCTARMGLSLDGFVARSGDELDFLPQPTDADLAEFSAWLASFDVILQGRRTWDVVQSFGSEAWPYGRTPVRVWTRAEPGEPPGPQRSPAHSFVRGADPQTVLEGLAGEGFGRVYVDGPSVVQQFLAAGLLDELDLGLVPVLIGNGVRLWGALPGDRRLELLACEVGAAGLVRVRYGLARAGA